MSQDAIVIVSAARTPIGGLLGDFANLAAWELGGVAIKLLEYVAHEVPSVAARFATGGYDLGANVNVVENDVGAWVTAIEHAVNAPRQRSDTFEHPRWSAAHYANVAFA